MAFSDATGAAFEQWYSLDTPAITRELLFTRVGQGMWEYNNDRFYPLDGVGCNDTEETEQGTHNYFFTTEIALVFHHVQGEGRVFEFSGDDDVWVFVDSSLVLDIGGVHGEMSGSVYMDSLSLGNDTNHALRIFHAERQIVGSNFRAKTSIMLEDELTCPNQCYSPLGHGQCQISTGICECCPGWGDLDCGTANYSTIGKDLASLDAGNSQSSDKTLGRNARHVDDSYCYNTIIANQTNKANERCVDKYAHTITHFKINGVKHKLGRHVVHGSIVCLCDHAHTDALPPRDGIPRPLPSRAILLICTSHAAAVCALAKTVSRNHPTGPACASHHHQPPRRTFFVLWCVGAWG